MSSALFAAGLTRQRDLVPINASVLAVSLPTTHRPHRASRTPDHSIHYPNRSPIKTRSHTSTSADVTAWAASCASMNTPHDLHGWVFGTRRVANLAGLDPDEWTPRELRHSFVSLLSDSGVRLEDIADLCGHAGTTVTGKIYRHQLRPVLLHGAVAMDRIFDEGPAA
jgi:integrase